MAQHIRLLPICSSSVLPCQASRTRQVVADTRSRRGPAGGRGGPKPQTMVSRGSRPCGGAQKAAQDVVRRLHSREGVAYHLLADAAARAASDASPASHAAAAAAAPGAGRLRPSLLRVLSCRARLHTAVPSGQHHVSGRGCGPKSTQPAGEMRRGRFDGDRRDQSRVPKQANNPVPITPFQCGCFS